MLTPQFSIPTHHELAIDLFAGGGGASTGMEQALGRPADEAPTLTLGAINERLHPISVSAAGLAEFGIEPLATRKAAKMYSEAQFEQACRAIVRCATDALRIKPKEQP